MSAGRAGAGGQAKSPAELLKETIAKCRQGMAAAAVFSLFINLLMLALPLYMLQVFDRVLLSRSSDTLVMLTVIAIGALVAFGLLDAVRGALFARLGAWLDRKLSGTVLAGSIAGIPGDAGPRSAQGLRDLSVVRNFLSGPGMFPILDAPWTPIFVAVIYIMHPVLGLLALGGAIFLLVLATVNELITRRLLRLASGASAAAMQNAEAAVRNADVIEAMGMLPNVVRRWYSQTEEARVLQAKASGRSGAITALSKFIRLGLQIGILGVGAYLVILGEITPGTMIAASILMGRALAPVDMAIGSWRSAIAARAAYARVKQQIAAMPARGQAVPLPTPIGGLSVEGVTAVYPGATEPTLQNITFQLEPGESLGVIGASAAGKTTLARLLVGTAAPRFGHVRLDGADIARWDPEDRGRHIGYLPQDVELFAGSVRENVARLGEDDGEGVVAATQVAGAHELVLRLPAGYETEIGEGGSVLSGGQRQRIALARALYGEPRFVVLDEPASNLDQEGEQALLDALATLKARGATVIVIAHRPNILRQVDKILVLQGGGVHSFGPRDEILPKLVGPAGNRRPRLEVRGSHG